MLVQPGSFRRLCAGLILVVGHHRFVGHSKAESSDSIAQRGSLE
jgi:hypothetical protein